MALLKCESYHISFDLTTFFHIDLQTACLPEAKEQFWNQFDEACTTTCNVLTMNSSLPSLLVGAYGEESVMPTLRLALATVENSLEGAGEKLARSGVIVPLSDILKDALSGKLSYTGEYLLLLFLS